jgi:hypothetical protein
LKEDVPSEALIRKRLILTNQLAWQLFPVLQYEYLKENATLAYRKITYRVARSALEEACTFISSFTDNPSLHSCAADRQVLSIKAARNPFSEKKIIFVTWICDLGLFGLLVFSPFYSGFSKSSMISQWEGALYWKLLRISCRSLPFWRDIS